jgi:hypothetical protein
VTVIRLELEVDGDVYPELQAALTGLSNGSRGERLRQLAAAGLVWETMRMRGSWPAAVAAAPSPAEPPPTRNTTRSTRSAARTTEVQNSRPGAGRASPALVRDNEPVPVLHDVVSLPSRGRQPSAALPRPVDDVADGPDTQVDDDAPVALAAPVMHKSVSRSRVLRMKEMGLFKNG